MSVSDKHLILQNVSHTADMILQYVSQDLLLLCQKPPGLTPHSQNGAEAWQGEQCQKGIAPT